MSGLGSRTFGRYHNRIVLGLRLKKRQAIEWGDATPLNREERRSKAKAERRALTKG